jgi:hypothetical protein
MTVEKSHDPVHIKFVGSTVNTKATDVVLNDSSILWNKVYTNHPNKQEFIIARKLIKKYKNLDSLRGRRGTGRIYTLTATLSSSKTAEISR